MSDKILDAVSVGVVATALLALFGLIEIPLWASFVLAGVALASFAYSVWATCRD